MTRSVSPCSSNHWARSPLTGGSTRALDEAAAEGAACVELGGRGRTTWKEPKLTGKRQEARREVWAGPHNSGWDLTLHTSWSPCGFGSWNKARWLEEAHQCRKAAESTAGAAG